MKLSSFFRSDLPRDPHGRSHVWGGSKMMHESSAQTSGIAAGTKVATEFGWRTVEALQVGDAVLTFDNGLQNITRIERTFLRADASAPAHLRPLRVPVGALGNDAEMTLLPDQSVMLESDLAEVMFGDAFVLLRAADLLEFGGIERTATQENLEILALYFEDEQVVFANDNALLHCMSAQSLSVEALINGNIEAGYDVLKPAIAEAFVVAMRLGEASLAASMTGGLPSYGRMSLSL